MFSLHLLRQYIFLIPLVVMILSEITKVAFADIRGKTWHEHLFRPGGMPSSHSAFVTSLAIVVGKKLGVESPEFAIAFSFACIVWYDAIAVRKTLGQQGAILNRLQQWHHFAERLGHSFVEVVFGILFGAAITLVGIYLW